MTIKCAIYFFQYRLLNATGRWIGRNFWSIFVLVTKARPLRSILHVGEKKKVLRFCLQYIHRGQRENCQICKTSFKCGILHRNLPTVIDSRLLHLLAFRLKPWGKIQTELISQLRLVGGKGTSLSSASCSASSTLM
jgi:hypothetical protein